MSPSATGMGLTCSEIGADTTSCQAPSTGWTSRSCSTPGRPMSRYHHPRTAAKSQARPGGRDRRRERRHPRLPRDARRREHRTALAETRARELLQQLTVAGRAFTVDDAQVDATTEVVRPQCRSNDPHVVALAQVSGARLLYSNDTTLHQDFGDPQLINAPRGSVFSTNRSDRFSRHHRRLLRRTDLCSAARRNSGSLAPPASSYC